MTTKKIDLEGAQETKPDGETGEVASEVHGQLQRTITDDPSTNETSAAMELDKDKIVDNFLEQVNEEDTWTEVSLPEGNLESQLEALHLLGLGFASATKEEVGIYKDRTNADMTHFISPLQPNSSLYSSIVAIEDNSVFDSETFRNEYNLSAIPIDSTTEIKEFKMFKGKKSPFDGGLMMYELTLVTQGTECSIEWKEDFVK